MRQLEKPVDWYDLVCQRIDALRDECAKGKVEDECRILPPAYVFDMVKKDVEDLRRLADFPKNLPVADVWLGPEGQLGLTWEFEDEKSIDLIYAPNKKVKIIRFTDDLEQHKVEPSQLPYLLAKLAA
jgi:hypothetical protein